MLHATARCRRSAPKPAASRRRSQARRQARRAAGMEPRRSLCRHGRAGAQARPRSGATPTASRSRRATRASSRDLAAGRRGDSAGRGGRATRRSRTCSAGIVLLCRPPLCRRHHRSGAREVLRRRAGAHHRRLARIFCSSRSSSTGSTTPCSTRRWRDPALGHYRPWIEDIRKEKPYQLEDRVEQLFHEKSVTGRGAWNRLFDETIAGAALQGRRQGAGARADAQPAAGSRRREAQGGGRGAGRRPSRRTCGSFTLITNTLAKDKEISDRWRGFKDVADARHLSNRVEPEVVDALVAAVRAAYPRLSHRYYALKAQLVRQGAAAALGPQRAAAEGAAAHRSRWDEARDDRARRLRRVLAGDGGHRRALLRRALDRRAGAARQGARRLRASDRAVGASLCAAQLPGQAARRDDARARARPRRAPGARRAERAR